MHRLVAFFILLLAWYCGDLIATATGIPIPAPIWGMALVFVLLVMLRRVPADLDWVAQFLLRHMSVMFVPATLAVVLYGDLIRQHGVVLGVTLLVSTALSLVLTSLIGRRWLGHGR